MIAVGADCMTEGYDKANREERVGTICKSEREIAVLLRTVSTWTWISCLNER